MDSFVKYKFCNSEFWNTTTVWNSPYPEFSSCFRDTALVLAPSLLILLVLFCETYRIRKSRRIEIEQNSYNKLRIKLVFTLFVLKSSESFIYLSATAIGYAGSINEVVDSEGLNAEKDGGSTLVISALIAPLIKSLCYLILIQVYHHQRKAGLHTSAAVWFYLLLTVLCNSLDFYSLIVSLQTTIYNSIELAVELLHYPLLLLLFILECRGDTPIVEQDPNDPRPSLPKLEASFFSIFTFCWLNQLLINGSKSPITFATLWRTHDHDQAKNLVPLLRDAWCKIKVSTSLYQAKATYRSSNGGRQPANNLMLVLFKLYWNKFLFAATIKFCQDSLQYITPMLLKLLLAFMVSTDEPSWHGYLFALLLLIIPTIQSVLLGNYFCYMYRMGFQVKTMVIGAIYRKALLLSGSSRLKSTSGDIVNLMSVDSERFCDLAPVINLIWSAPYQTSLAIFLLYRELGWCVAPGVGLMLCILPLNAYLIKRIKFSQVQVMETKDQRVKQMNELLGGIKVVKLYAWENSFMEKLFGFRNKELRWLNTIVTLDAFQTFLWQCSPFMIALASFTCYINASPENILTIEKAFVSISLFNLMKGSLYMFPNMITTLVLTLVSARRISKFLNNDELVRYVTRQKKPTEAITIEKGTVSWFENHGATEPVLKDIDFHVEPKSFVAIVGQVASGKSSLLASILDEMHHISGRFNVCKSSSIAYVAQQAWIQNMTIRDNILFGKQYDEIFYKQTIAACSLEADLETFPSGDQAEIGEKGINLSGGQKQRVSLARACYSNSDIYLLDDPLSALDSHVAKHVFDQVFSSETGILREKTRILATNSLFVLPYVDRIVVLDQGKIVESGKFVDLLASPHGYMVEYMRQYSSQERQQEASEVVLDTSLDQKSTKHEVDNLKSPKVNSGTGKLIEPEELETERVNYRVYLSYFESFSWAWLVATTGSLLASVIFNVSTNIWMSIWSHHSSNRDSTISTTLGLTVYGSLGGFQSLSVLLGSLALSRGAIRASRLLHLETLTKVLHSPMSFFDITPMGRILNRFSKDIDVVDSTLPPSFRNWFIYVLQMLSTIFIICYSFPSFLIIVSILVVLFCYIQKMFISTTRQLKRLESISKSPIYSQFDETLSGLSTIRAYGSVERFIDYSDHLIDRNQSCNYPNCVAARWLSTRLEMFGNLITSVLAAFSVYHKQSISAEVVGLAIAYSLSSTQTMSLLIRYQSDLEANIVSVERLVEYIGNKLEDMWVKPNLRPSSSWPQRGAIQLSHYSTRYREDTELVLKDLNINIKPGEKLGIVGRTGSGKSSLSLSLFRILEPTSGSIKIDGIDMAQLGLHDLRSKLTIIPQDPVLFSGTLRFNLDPLKIYNDFEVWRAIELAHLKSCVANLQLGLDHQVTDYGGNFSVGQRQLICLARAILRKSKILILDEATASVDLETDSIVQKTIRKVFADCTIITIAHRLHTILDSDTILVLDQGTVKELGAPGDLISNPNSEFASLIKDAGIDARHLMK